MLLSTSDPRTSPKWTFRSVALLAIGQDSATKDEYEHRAAGLAELVENLVDNLGKNPAAEHHVADNHHGILAFRYQPT